MNNILKKLQKFGFAKGNHKILNNEELKTLKTNIEQISKQQDLKKNPFVEICGHNQELDRIIEKILSDNTVQETLKSLLGEDYILWGGGSVRVSVPNDKGLILHQDAPGETGLIFLVNDQPKSSTVVLSGSHFFSRISQKLSWNSPKIFYYLRNILSPLSGKAGEFYFWFYKTWHGRLPNKTSENYISIFFPFFPKGTDRVQMLKECNEERVDKVSSNYIKKLLNNHQLSKEIGPNKDLECMKIENFYFKNIFQISFIICFLKIVIFEILFFPIRVLRILRK